MVSRPDAAPGNAELARYSPCANKLVVIQHGSSRQYRRGLVRDGMVEIADELRRRFVEYDDVPSSVQEFMETAVRR